MDVFSGALRGWGFSLLPAVVTTAGICVLRVIYVYTVFAGWPDFGVLMGSLPAELAGHRHRHHHCLLYGKEENHRNTDGGVG